MNESTPTQNIQTAMLSTVLEQRKRIYFALHKIMSPLTQAEGERLNQIENIIEAVLEGDSDHVDKYICGLTWAEANQTQRVLHNPSIGVHAMMEGRADQYFNVRVVVNVE